jgi:two-component system nitrogen regulation sensor histidine kinase NtrY
LNLRYSKKGFLSKNTYLLIAAAWAITISFIIDNYWSGTSTHASVQKTIQKDIQKKQKDFEEFCADTILLNKLALNQYDETTLDKIRKKKYFIFIYRSGDAAQDSCVFWSTQIVQPDSIINKSAHNNYITKLLNGWYVVNKKSVTSAAKGSYIIVSLIPVKWQYYISNKYLSNSFSAINKIENDYEISFQPKDLKITALDGSILFYLHPINSNIKLVQNNAIAILLKFIAVLLVFIFIHIAAHYIALKQGLFKGLLVLFIPVIILRALSYFIPVPLNFRQLELFDPAIYGSNYILRSLGDLLINSLIFLWFILFIRYHLQDKPLTIKPVGKLKRLLIIAVISSILLLATFVCGHIIRSLVADSQISFDVINFFTLSFYSVVGFIVLSCVATGYFFLSQILSYTLSRLTKGESYLLYITISVLSLTSLSFMYASPSPYVSFNLLLLLWLLLFVFLLNRNYRSSPAAKLISSQYVFWIFFFSVSITSIIVLQNKNKELAVRKHFAENLANKADPVSETMLNIVLTDFNNNFLSQVFPRLKNETENRLIKDSLININFLGYINKYDTRIYTFDENEKPLFNVDSTTYNALNTVVETQAKSTTTEGLYYYDVSYDRFNYIIKKQVTDTTGNIMGHVFILSNPKKYKSDALYPELFSRGNANSIENSTLYAFAVYNKNQLSISHNDYAFATKINAVKLLNNEFWTKKRNGYDELWYKASGDKVIVIAKPDSFYIESITLFAYLFCAFLLLFALLRLLNVLVQKKFNFRKIKLLSGLTIRTQIHGTIILISIFSFVIIGITTILFFIKRYHNNNQEKLSRSIQVMQNEVRNSLDTFSLFEGPPQNYRLQANSKLDSSLHKIAEIYTADINLYDLNGNLQVSTLPLPYTKGIVSKKMDPKAFYHLKKLKDVQFFQEQKIGELIYLNNYVPVRNETGNEFAYLNIPYFESESKLEEEISNFLVTIINLNAFIFIIAGIIALFITNRVTQSFSFISNKMKEVNLGKINEMISWHRKDEIGGLVKEYNKMVMKLDTSAERLARSEREGAWREMARQVAHEIKNPLTPMKLNLQYLQNAINSNAPNVKNISVYVAKILVEQIDHLSQIAGDFAQFANIGETKNQFINLTDSLKQVTSLYSSDENQQITMDAHSDSIIIQADKTQINRLFTNLIQNAIQSVPDDRKAVIEIHTSGTGDEVLIKIKDNGKGIPADMISKIFTPNFTTKSSGTGLGLAMCKGIVEKSNGKIWFETTEGISTTFFVQFPLAVVANT